jgi:23S rRNA pseudouridine1911/1915/1917 synthase
MESVSVKQHDLVVAPEAAGTRLDRWLTAQLPDLTRSRLKALIEAGNLTVAGATITDPSHRVKPGQRFRLAIPPPVAAIPAAQEIPLTVVYEDDAVIVIDKLAGMVVHPAPGNPDRTLVNALLAHCGADLTGIGGVARPGIVHRLDKDTSGLLLAAKTAQAHAKLVADFAGRRVSRIYHALVWGVPSRPSGTIEANIGRHPKDRKRMAVRRDGGRAAITHYRVLRAFAGMASLVECRLATGRTHQIRVHMAELGHPLLGDPVYAGRKRGRALPPALLRAAETLARQALHAVEISFDHPARPARIRLTSGYPSDFKVLLTVLETLSRPIQD